MALTPETLITRQPIVDRNRQIAFQRLAIANPEQDTVIPFVLRLANIETPQAVYFLPVGWVQDPVLMKKLARDMILVVRPEELETPAVEAAGEAGFRIALAMDGEETSPRTGDFTLTPWHEHRSATPDTIYSDIVSEDQETLAKATMAMYYCGPYLLDTSKPVPGGKRMNPSHALILELMGAVQQEAEPKEIEAMFKRDVTLSFKLLRYINSPWFGLASRVESVRHALSIIGYQQLLKWLTLLAATAGQEASAVMTHSAMVRAKMMELIGSRILDKREADALFVTGMLSLLDRIMGVPMEDILQYVNLPESVTDALIRREGRYSRYLLLAMACEGQPLPEGLEMTDIDARMVNTAHLDAIEWATQAFKTV